MVTISTFTTPSGDTATRPRAIRGVALRPAPIVPDIIGPDVVGPGVIGPDDASAHQPAPSEPIGRRDTATVDDPRPPLWRRLVSWAVTAVIVAAIVFLWPARFGGSTRFVIVSGNSMEPTYHLGDMVVARAGDTPTVGDIVVFAVPEGEAEGMLVIHRVLEIDGEGRFVTQGDNRDTPDLWRLGSDDIVGRPLALLPAGGRVIWFLQQWVVIAVLLGILAMFLLWPESNDPDEPPADGDATGDVDLDVVADRLLEQAVARQALDELITRRTVHDIAADAAAFADAADPFDASDASDASDETVALLRPEVWSTADIDPAVMDDAMAWLDEQLNGVLDRS